MTIKRLMLVWLCLFSFFWGYSQELEKLSNEVNSVRYDEMSPVLSKDGHTLYFTRSGSPDFNKTLYINGKDVYTTDPEKYDRTLRKKCTPQLLVGRSVILPGLGFNQDVWIARSEE